MTTLPRDLTGHVGESTALIAGVSMAQKVASALTVFIIASGVSIGEFGTVRLVQATVATVGSFLLSGATAAVVAEGARLLGIESWGQFRGLVRSFVAALSGLSVVIAVCAVGGALVIQLRGGPNYLSLALVSGGLLIAGSAGAAVMATLQMFGNFRAFAAVRFTEQLSLLVTASIAVFVLRPGVIPVLAAYVAAQTISLFFGLVRFRGCLRSIPRSAAEGTAFWRILRGQGLWSLLSVYTKNAADTARLWIIKAVLGVEALGLYSLADSLFGHTVSLFPLASALLPTVSGDTDHQRVRRVFVRSVKYHFLVFGALALAGFFIAPVALGLVLPKYLPAVPLYRVILIGLVFAAPAALLTTYFTALKLQWEFWMLTIARSVLSLLFIWPMLTFFGVMGIGYEFVTSWLLFTAARFVVLRRRRPYLAFSWRELFTYDTFDRALTLRVFAWVKTKLRMSRATIL